MTYMNIETSCHMRIELKRCEKTHTHARKTEKTNEKNLDAQNEKKP